MAVLDDMARFSPGIGTAKLETTKIHLHETPMQEGYAQGNAHTGTTCPYRAKPKHDH